ncbi:MAG TPA: sodium/solute symporter [archaeon]|nr:sodium/solute symporter [archaeon]
MDSFSLAIFDIGVFVFYFVAVVSFGVAIARKEKKTSREYFLAGDRLPWYAIGASLTASNISAEHFVGMIGYAYAAGLVVANLEWGNWYTYSLLVWIFLPYYMRSGLYTMPEFLERRYNRTCRYLYAVSTLLTYVLAFLAAILYAGALVLEALFGLPLVYGVLLIAVTTSIYTVYGGLLSVVWTDFVQCIVLFAGGLVVTFLGLNQVGGLGNLLHELPQKFFMVYPTSHPQFPFIGMVGCVLSSSTWYVCTNQFMVQRCLGARSEWDARMGGIFAGYFKFVLPFIICLPGIIAFKLLGPDIDPNHVFPLLVQRVVPAGLLGLIMAGLASAIMSTVSSALNSASTVATLDLIVPLFRKGEATEEERVSYGRWISVLIMVVAVSFAILFSVRKGQVFLIIQNIYAYFAAPVAALFLLGIFWKRITSTAATVTFIAGFTLNELVDRVLFKIEPFSNYNAFYNRATIVFFLSLLILTVVSLVTKKPDPAVVDKICWRPSDMRLRGDGRSPHKLGTLAVAWVGMVVCILGIYAALGIFQWVKG